MARNVRLALASIDLVQPHVQLLGIEWDAGVNAPLSVNAGPAADWRRASAGVEPLGCWEIRWRVWGAVQVEKTFPVVRTRQTFPVVRTPADAGGAVETQVGGWRRAGGLQSGPAVWGTPDLSTRTTGTTGPGGAGAPRGAGGAGGPGGDVPGTPGVHNPHAHHVGEFRSCVHLPTHETEIEVRFGLRCCVCPAARSRAHVTCACAHVTCGSRIASRSAVRMHRRSVPWP